MYKESDRKEFYLGNAKSFYLGYASDSLIRKDAASGGFISSFLIYLLESNIIDGAYVSKTYIENGSLKAKAYIATSQEEILDSRTSIYMDFPYIQNLYELRNKNIKIAVVGLPCHLKTITKMEERYTWLKEKIVIKIGLFCSHSSSPQLINKIIKKEKIDLIDISNFYFRKGHWRGFLTFNMRDGTIKEIPYLNFGFYMNLYFYENIKCLSCNDHIAEYSDVSCGDAWIKKLKKNPVKHSTIVIYNELAEKYFSSFCEKKLFIANEILPELVIRTQKRGLIRKKHYIYAFKRLSVFFDIKTSYKGNNYSRWNHYIGAFLILLNIKISKNEKIMDFIFRLPNFILYPYLALVKFFMNF